MNSEVAYWTLSTIAIVTATLMGFLLVALVFYLESSIRQIKRFGKHPLGKPTGMIVFSVILLGLGAWTAYSEVSTIHDLPGASGDLTQYLASQVDSSLGAFKWFLVVVMVYVSCFILIGAWELYALMRRAGKADGDKREKEEV